MMKRKMKHELSSGCFPDNHDEEHVDDADAGDVVNCPTRWSLSLLFGFLWWSSYFSTQMTKKYSTAMCYWWWWRACWWQRACWWRRPCWWCWCWCWWYEPSSRRFAGQQGVGKPAPILHPGSFLASPGKPSNVSILWTNKNISPCSWQWSTPQCPTQLPLKKIYSIFNDLPWSPPTSFKTRTWRREWNDVWASDCSQSCQVVPSPFSPRRSSSICSPSSRWSLSSWSSSRWCHVVLSPLSPFFGPFLPVWTFPGILRALGLNGSVTCKELNITIREANKKIRQANMVLPFLWLCNHLSCLWCKT